MANTKAPYFCTWDVGPMAEKVQCAKPTPGDGSAWCLAHRAHLPLWPKDEACDGSRHAGHCNGGDWDRCTIPQGPRGYAQRLRANDLTDEDHEYETQLLASQGAQ